MNKFIVFVIGATIGSAVTWYLTKNKYERMARDEVEEMREFYLNKTRDSEPEPPTVEELVEYEEKLSEVGYIPPAEVKGDSGLKTNPYVIRPDEFGDADGYDAESLIYYADGVLTDSWNVPIEAVDTVVGRDSLNHFGEYEDDSVFVRNDEMKIDYEILRDERNFKDLQPHKNNE